MDRTNARDEVVCDYCACRMLRISESCPNCGSVNKFRDISRGDFEAMDPVIVEPIIVEVNKPSKLAKVVMAWLIFSMLSTVLFCILFSMGKL